MSLTVLSLGAGVQSTALLLLALEGEIERPDLVVFADTMWEPQAVYDHLAHLESLMAAAGFRYARVSAGDIRAEALAAARGEGRWFANLPFYVRSTQGRATPLRRQCSYVYKIVPIRAAIRALMRERGEKDAALWLGISLDEVERMKTSDVQWLRHVYPLVERLWTRQDCLNWMRSKGYAQPPRSACVGCPFRSDPQWRSLEPAEWADAVAFDAAIRDLPRIRGGAFLHHDLVPLPMVTLREARDYERSDAWGNECGGNCGL